MMNRAIRSALAVLCLMVVSSRLSAQEEAPKPETKAPETKMPETKAPETKAQPGPAAEQFQKLFTDWKSLLAELLELQGKYRLAKPEERGELRKQWNQLIEKGDALQPQLIEAAEKAFLEAPNADKGVASLLVDVLYDQLRADDYEGAQRLADVLIKHQCADNRTDGLAGLTAFVLADYDTAEKLLKAAKKPVSISRPKGPGEPDRELLDNLVQDFLRDPAKYKKAWAKETAIRDAEAKAEGKADALPRVLLTTSKGDVEIELFENEAPNTVANFISLVEKKFYDGVAFHRVLPGFMAQGGDPKGDGTGSPGYRIADECRQPNRRLHFRGSLSMANSGPDTNGSQFFLTFVPTKHLDGKHTVFGRVVKGFDVLSKLQRRDPEDPNLSKPDTIVEAKVLGKRAHQYVVKKMKE